MDIARMHILVVDDLVDAADTTVELLSIWGYDAVACYTGATALESGRLRRPGVVLLDLAMPAMDGFEFAELFHELPDCGSVPLIALSGYSSLAFRARAQKAGIHHYLLKPADAECLRELLEREIEFAVAPAQLLKIVASLPYEFPRTAQEAIYPRCPVSRSTDYSNSYFPFPHTQPVKSRIPSAIPESADELSCSECENG